MPAWKVKDNSTAVVHMLDSQLSAAANEIKKETKDSIQWQMLRGYHEPHGEDGHTAIYDTGALYDSIKVEVDSHDYGSAGLGTGAGAAGSGHGFTVNASANTEYASYVHQGTYKLNGRPFLTDGVNRIKPTITNIVKKHMSN